MSKHWRLALAALAFTLAPPGTGAQVTPTTLVRAALLRADKLPQAPVLRELAAGEAVELLALEGGWAWVVPRGQAQPRGWVRAGALAAAAPPSAAAALRSGRAGSTEGAVALGIRGPAEPGWHALLVLAGDNAADLEAARQIASVLGAEGERLRVLPAGEATAANIAGAVRALAAGLGRQDGLLLYLAGDGVQVPLAGGGCAGALRIADGQLLAGADLQGLLAPVAARRHPVLAVYDVSLAPAPAPLAAALQALQPVREADGRLRVRFQGRAACAAPQGLAGPQPEPPQRDVAVLAAGAGAALEDSEGGGLLTQFLRDCLLRDARGPDGEAPDLAAAQACMATRQERRLQALPPGAAAPVVAGDATLPLAPPGGSGLR